MLTRPALALVSLALTAPCFAQDLELRCEGDASCSFYVRSSGTLELLP